MANRSGRTIKRIAVAFESGRDGFWAGKVADQTRDRSLIIIHSSSVAVSREHKRAKTDRLDTAMLKRVFLGWLRGEYGHAGMVAVPLMRSRKRTPSGRSRERENLVGERTRIINRLKSALIRLGIRWHRQ